MEKRKIISIIVSMAMLFSSMAALHVTAEDEATTKTILDDGFHFMDIAHNGNTIVAMAKAADNIKGKVYYSADGGNTWKPSENQPSGLSQATATISANPISQQQLVYIPGKKLFALHTGKDTYVSADGVKWSVPTASSLHQNSNTMIAASGDYLIMGTKDMVGATNDTTAKNIVTHELKDKSDNPTSGIYTQIIAAKPADENGNVAIIAANQSNAFDVSFKADNGVYTWVDGDKTYGQQIFEKTPYDAVYSPRTDQYFAVDGEKLQVFTTAAARPRLVVSDGDKVTGVNACADYVIVGMNSGKFFYNNSTQILNSTNNVWTEIPVIEGMTAATEPIKNIEILDDGSFVALGTTQIYKGTVSEGYKNINEKDVEPSATPSASPSTTPNATPTPTPSATPSASPSTTPNATPSASPSTTPSATPSASPSATPSASPSASPSVSPSASPSTSPSESPEPGEEKPFKNVRLIGGTYSPSLGTYVVYGDTSEKIAMNPDKPDDKRYWGMTYESQDAVHWGTPWQSYTYTQRTFGDAEQTKVTGYSEVRNGAVWWENQNSFLVSASIRDHSGTVMRSGEATEQEKEQGRTIRWRNTEVQQTDFRLNAEMAVCGNNLYTTNATRVLRKYTNWSASSADAQKPTDVITLPDTSITNMNQIAVGSTEDASGLPAILMTNGNGGAVRNDESTASTEEEKWTETNNLVDGPIVDAVYSDKLKTFVTVAKSGTRTAILNKENVKTKAIEGPIVSGKICNAIDTNGEVFMFACEDGNIYTAPDDENFATATLEKVPSAQKVENKMNVTNVFKAGDKFIATVSDNKDSDVLIISKGEDGSYSYISVTEELYPSSDIPTPSPSASPNPDASPSPSPSATPGVDPITDYSVKYKDGKALVTAPEGTYTVIFAAYASDGKLVSVAIRNDVQVSEPDTQVLALKFTTAGAVSGKVMLWDSLSNMKPLAMTPIPFN